MKNTASFLAKYQHTMKQIIPILHAHHPALPNYQFPAFTKLAINISSLLKESFVKSYDCFLGYHLVVITRSHQVAIWKQSYTILHFSHPAAPSNQHSIEIVNQCKYNGTLCTQHSPQYLLPIYLRSTTSIGTPINNSHTFPPLQSSASKQNLECQWGPPLPFIQLVHLN